MPPVIPFDQRLGRGKANQGLRHVVTSWAFLWGASLDVPGGRGVDGEDGNLCFGEGRDDGGKGIAEGAFEGEPEDGVDDVVGLGEGLREVGREWDREGLELGGQALGR